MFCFCHTGTLLLITAVPWYVRGRFTGSQGVLSFENLFFPSTRTYVYGFENRSRTRHQTATSIRYSHRPSQAFKTQHETLQPAPKEYVGRDRQNGRRYEQRVPKLVGCGD